MSTEIVYPSTLATALADTNLSAGSRLLLRGGTYTEGDLRCFLSGVTITNYPGETVIIRSTSGYRCFLFQDVENIVLSGLVIDAENVTNEGIKITNASNNIRVTNCEIKNCGTHGILLSQNIHHIEIDHCNIHHCGLDHFDHGIYLWSNYAGFHAVVHDNQITDCASNGVHAYAGGEGYYVIRNNYLANHREVGIGCYYGQAMVYNNVIRNCPRGVTARYQTLRAMFAYNTMYACAEAVELNELQQPAPRVEIFNTLYDGVIGNHTEYAFNVNETNFRMFSNLQTALADAGGANITASSRGIGQAIAGMSTDYVGGLRGNPPTIGAWE